MAFLHHMILLQLQHFNRTHTLKSIVLENEYFLKKEIGLEVLIPSPI